MSKAKIFSFLHDLAANNSKDWMDANRKRYHEAKQLWLDEIAIVLERLAQHDPSYASIDPKKTITRITNNNRRFNPDLPLYHTHFACAPTFEMSQPTFFMTVGTEESFLGGGTYRPPSKTLKKIREAIDYDGAELRKIVEAKDFQDFYEGIAADEQKLKTSPRGYADDHPQVELLRYKSFTTQRPFTEAEFVRDDFVDLAERAYLAIRPFNEYLRRAVNFTE